MGSSPTPRIKEMKIWIALFLYLRPTCVSLAPNITEIIYSSNLENHLIANTIYCNYPKEAKIKEKIGGVINPDIEKILTLKPDYIFGINPLNNRACEELKKKRDFMNKCFVLNINSLQDIQHAFFFIDSILGDKSGYKTFKMKTEKTLSALKKPILSPLVYIELSQKPLYTTGDSTFINEAIKIAGGKNIFSKFKGYKMISQEDVIKKNPDIILLLYVNASSTQVEKRSGWERIKAVKKHNVYNLNPDIFVRPGPRILQAIVLLNKIFYNAKY